MKKVQRLIMILNSRGWSNDRIIIFLHCSRRQFFRWKRGESKPQHKHREKVNTLYSWIQKKNPQEEFPLED